MKIAMIGLRGIPAKSGGVEAVVEHLAPRLVKLGCDVTVYCRNPYCKTRPKTFKGVKLRYLPTLNTKHAEAVVHSFLATLHVLTRKYDIVHYHAMGNGLFSIVPRGIGKKTIVTLHGLDWQREKWGVVAKSFLKLSERAISRFPNTVISVSEKIQHYYKEKYKKDILFIPNGVDLQKPRKLDKLKRFGLEKEKYVLFLSRIVPEKGVHTLIKAFKNTKTDQKLLIVGDAPHSEGYLKQLKALARDDDRIIFTGPLFKDDKAEAYSNCSFFVLPSTIEGMPLVLLEAMSFGKCPLVSDIRENRDVVKDHGFSFRVNDEQDLGRRLTFMLAHPELLKERGTRAKAAVKKAYDWDAVARRTLRSYEGVLRGTKP